MEQMNQTQDLKPDTKQELKEPITKKAIELDIKLDPTRVISDLYSYGYTKYTLMLKDMRITIKSLTVKEIELFNLLISKATMIQSGFLTQTMFELLYSKWLLTFTITNVEHADSKADFTTDQERILKMYNNILDSITDPDEFTNKVNGLYKAGLDIQTKILNHISVYLFDVLGTAYQQLNEQITDIVNGDLKN